MSKGNGQSTESGFPARLKQLRTEKGFSQSELAKLVGLHYTHIGRYERGDSQPTADKIRKLAEVLGVSGDYLLDTSTEDVAKANLNDREMLELFKEVEQLTSDDRQVIKKLMLAFVNQRKIRELAAK